MKYLYGDPANILEGVERRTVGCYSCRHSKRGLLENRITSYCEFKIKDYPNVLGTECQFYIKRITG